MARLGALRRGSTFPSPYEQLRSVSHIILHPGYVDAGFLNDISLLRLREPVQFSDFVRPVCLPPAPIRDGRLCTVVGWGQLFEVGRIFRKSPIKYIVAKVQSVNTRFHMPDPYVTLGSCLTVSNLGYIVSNGNTIVVTN